MNWEGRLRLEQNISNCNILYFEGLENGLYANKCAEFEIDSDEEGVNFVEINNNKKIYIM